MATSTNSHTPPPSSPIPPKIEDETSIQKPEEQPSCSETKGTLSDISIPDENSSSGEHDKVPNPRVTKAKKVENTGDKPGIFRVITASAQDIPIEEHTERAPQEDIEASQEIDSNDLRYVVTDSVLEKVTHFRCPGFAIYPNRTCEVVELAVTPSSETKEKEKRPTADYKILQGILGGYIEILIGGDNISELVAYVNEDGLLLQLETNSIARWILKFFGFHPGSVVGPVVLVGDRDKGLDPVLIIRILLLCDWLSKHECGIPNVIECLCMLKTAKDKLSAYKK